MNRTIMPAMPAAKNFAVFSLSFWRSTFAKVALALAALVAVSVAFSIVNDKLGSKSRGVYEGMTETRRGKDWKDIKSGRPILDVA